MPIATAASLVDAIRDTRLLEPGQLQEVTEKLQNEFPDPVVLAKELVKRGWLTLYQANQLINGRGKELLLDPYIVLERLGEGGMGQVFKAKHRGLGRLAALKVIRKERVADADAIRRFQREVRAAAQLSHPNVVLAYDADECNGTHYIAMEFVDGIDLAKLVKEQGPLPVLKACDYMRQAALGLQHAHEQGLVHRDIKPANLLVARPVAPGSAGGLTGGSGAKSHPPAEPGATGVVKILDMGLARIDTGAEGDSGSTLTQEGSVMGTLDYIAPEQAMDAHKADIRADLYSLGCTFYFLLTGRVPFPGGSAMEKLLKHRLRHPTPVESLRPDVPHAVGDVIRKLMAKRLADRYQTPKELAEELDSLTKAVDLSSRTVNIGQNPPPATAGSEPTVTTSETPHEPLEKARLGDIAPGRKSSAVKRKGLRRPQNWRKLVKERPWLAVAVGTGALVSLVLMFVSIVAFFYDGGPTPVVDHNAPSKPGGPKPGPPTKPDGSKPRVITPVAKPGEWVPLFNGKDLTGWAPGGNATWTVVDGILTSGGDNGRLWTERGDYQNFHLRAELQLNAGGDSGIFFRVPVIKKTHECYQAQLWDAGPGNLHRFGPPEPASVPVKIKYWPSPNLRLPTGKWTLVEIIADGSHFTIKYDGQIVVEIDDPEPCLAPGYLALEQWGANTVVQFRKIEIKELPPSATTQPGKQFTNSIGMKLNLIPSGKFLMGSPETEATRDASERPPREVAIAAPFYLGTHEVTVGQFRAFVQATGYMTEAEKDGTGANRHVSGESWKMDPTCTWQNPGWAQTDDHPVVCVSWNDAVAFCQWLSQKEGKTYRLPADAEWEHACRAGTTTAFAFGATLSSKEANFDGNQPYGGAAAGPFEKKTVAVGSYAANAFGLYDLHGNVWEWCQEASGSGPNRIMRGGGWFNAGYRCRSANRAHFPPTFRINNVGFRVVMEPGPRDAAGPTLVNLSELNSTVYNWSPWLSEDGLTLYAEDGAWIWTARRKDANSPFENKTRLIQGRMPALTADQLQIILVKTGSNERQTLHTASRPALDQPFGEPREITALVRAPMEDVRMACLSPDGLTLYFQRNDKQVGGTGIGFHVSTRKSLQADWEPSQPLLMAMNKLTDSSIAWPFVTADGKTLLCNHEGSNGQHRFIVWTRPTLQVPFDNPQYLEIFGIADLVGRSPRYVERTNELFFAAPRVRADANAGFKDADLWVIKNFKLGDPSQKPPPPRVPGGNSIGMKLTLVPAGEFTMGSDSINEAKPPHKVRITRPFLMGTHEVTVGQFRAFAQATGYKTEAEKDGKGIRVWENNGFVFKPELTWDKPRWTVTEDQPVIGISWNDAVAFCEWLSKKEGRVYRLPTEAEWEYACRAGTTTAYSFGDTLPPDQANFQESKVGRPKPVGSYPANAFGLHDMHGNASEWCADFYDAKYYQNSPADDPLGPAAGTDHVSRGGGCFQNAAACQSAARRAEPNRYLDQGFRVACVPEDQQVLNSLGMKLSFIPAGKFLMGSPNTELARIADEGPQHEVTLTKPFYMSSHEVTVGQFRAFVEATGYQTEAEKDGKGAARFTRFPAGPRYNFDSKCNWKNPSWQQGDNHPVVCVSYDDAVAFCEWLSKKEGKTYRLPTEAEWEYACRAGTTTPFAFGPTLSAVQANIDGTQPYGNVPPSPFPDKPLPVGSYAPNRWGLYDMHGNVWEWCSDFYDAKYYQNSPKVDPVGPAPTDRRLRRGGSFEIAGVYSRSTHRQMLTPGLSHKTNTTGFRVVREEQISNSIGMKLNRLPAGDFFMGSTDPTSAAVERPQHSVRLTRTFYVGVYEVTQADYEKVMGKNPAEFHKDNGGGPDFPVEKVSWDEAVEFCKKLSELPNERQAGRVYHLPTEAEWEYACRAGTTASFAFDQFGPDKATFKAIKPTKVGSYAPNRFGLHDLHGNVWEWCADWYDATYYEKSPLEDPPGPATGIQRIERGGGYNATELWQCKSNVRGKAEPSYRSGTLGFRVVCVTAERGTSTP